MKFFRADFLVGDNAKKVDSRILEFLLVLSGKGQLNFLKITEDFEVERGDAIVVPHCVGAFTLNGCKGIISPDHPAA
jgi:mannose-6-phosphate isomerase class I